MTDTGPASLRRRLSLLVYREAANRTQIGIALAMMPLIYVLVIWPPPAIRAALIELEPLARAQWLLAAHAIYLFATHGVTQRVIASARLAWWWQLPLSPSWWRTLHLRHLLLLHSAWLAIIVYALIPRASGGEWAAAILIGVGHAGWMLAAVVGLVAWIDRRWPVRVLLGLAVALVAGAAVWAPAWAIAAAGLGAATLAIRRLGRPMPERSSRSLGLGLRGGSRLALARTILLAGLRRESVAVVGSFVLQAILLVLVGFAIAQVGERARPLQRGVAVVIAVVEAGLLTRGLRTLAADRALMRSWGIASEVELAARILAVLLAGLPVLVGGQLVLSLVGPVGHAWALDHGVALVWASVGGASASFSDEIHDAIQKPRLGRTFLRVIAGAILVSIAESVLVLLAWTGLEVLRLPSSQARAERVRARREATIHDDHGD